MQNQPRPQESLWTILKLLQWTTSYFRSRDIENPRASAEILLAHALHKERIDLYLCYDQPLSGEELERYKALIKKRIKREPDAYITGTKEFWSMELAVGPDVLIPRPETECLVEAVHSILSKVSSKASLRILELGTGSGAITLALVSQMPGHVYFATDCSIEAVRLAKRNAVRHHFDDKVHFLCADWLAPFCLNNALFDVIVSNPPYIKTGSINDLQPEIYKYEPVIALDGGQDGLDSLRRIINSAHRYLNKDGWLFLEIGFDQKDRVGNVITECGRYSQVVFSKDYSECDRVVSMRKK